MSYKKWGIVCVPFPFTNKIVFKVSFMRLIQYVLFTLKENQVVNPVVYIKKSIPARPVLLVKVP